MNVIGLSQQQAESMLKKAGIINIVCENNFKFPLDNSTLLVTSCKIKNNTATITLGSFKLDL